MAYGKNRNKFRLKEGKVEIGVWTDPETVGTDGEDPVSKFTPAGIVGTLKQGTLAPNITAQFAEFLEGTPRKKVRKDVVQKDFTLEFELAEWNLDLLRLSAGLTTQAAYSVTTPTTKQIDLAHIGSDETPRAFHGYLITATLVDGTPIYYAMYKGMNTSEDLGWGLSGGDHGTTKFRVEAFDHENFEDDQADRNYGFIQIDPTAA